MLYEHQRTRAQNNFSLLTAGTMSMEAGNPSCYRNDLVMATWSDTASDKVLFEGGVLLLNTETNTFENPCAGIPTGRLYRDTTLSFAFNGNGPLQTESAQQPFKQRFSMSYITGSHHFKVGMAAEESLPRLTRTDRGPTPFTYTFRAGVPISLTRVRVPRRRWRVEDQARSGHLRPGSVEARSFHDQSRAALRVTTGCMRTR